jgi:hypothetical protein
VLLKIGKKTSVDFYRRKEQKQKTISKVIAFDKI